MRARQDERYQGVAFEVLVRRWWMGFSKKMLSLGNRAKREQRSNRAKQRSSGQWLFRKLTWTARSER